MLYKFEIKDRSDTNYWKNMICIYYKTYAAEN